MAIRSFNFFDGSDGFRILGVDSGDNLGFSLSDAGDVNSDGVDDLIISAFAGDTGNRSGAGESYVIFGAASGFGATFNPSALNG